MYHDDSTIPFNEDDPRRSVFVTDVPTERDESLFLMYTSEKPGHAAWHWLDVEAAKELRAELNTFIARHEESS